jgi:hypothetical protein
MSKSHRGRTLFFAVGAAIAAFAGSVSAAVASQAPPADGGGYVTGTPTTVVVTHTGAPGWTYLVVAVAAAALTLTLAWAVTRFRHAHVVSARAA